MIDANSTLKASSTFKARLHAVLEFDDIDTMPEKIMRMVACGVSRSTARRYLTDDSFEGGKTNSGGASPLSKLAAGLDISLYWLVCGHLEDLDANTPERWAAVAGLSNRWRLIHLYQATPEDLHPKVVRLFIRILNNDRKVARLMDMFERGQISREQLLRQM